VTTQETKSEDPPPEELAKRAGRPTLFGAIRTAISHWWGSGYKGLEDKSSNELAEIRTDLAATRTLMGADRTLMAWVRTSLSMDSFGFTIYKVLQGFQEAGKSLPQGYTPQSIGLFLTGLGTVAMVMGTVEYWGTLREVHQLQDFRLARPALIMAVLMSVLGVFLFVSIITELF